MNCPKCGKSNFKDYCIVCGYMKNGNYIGKTKVIIRCNKTNNLYQIPSPVNVSNALLYELYEQIGENNTIFK